MMKAIRIILAVGLLMGQLTLLAQINGTIKGEIVDEISGQAVPFVSVKISDSDPPKGTVSDMEGKFQLEVPVGRYTLEYSSVGYDPYLHKEVLVTSGKDVVLTAALRESVTALSEVVVKPKINKQEPVNQLAGINARMLSVEEANRFAGGFDDPARLATSFAGVSSNMQSNGIVVRGNNPQSMLWRMEGVEITNPNHFADLAVFGGGGLTALSSQMMANSDFLTGAFPASYGNAVSGVFDLNMRSGNADRVEKTIQVGLLGIDLSSEGPIKKNSKTTFLFNYRYSSLALLKPVLPEGADGIKYQDLSYKFKIPTKSAGLFTVWGIGLLDKSGIKADNEPADWEYEKDGLNEDVRQYMGATGVKHVINVGQHNFFESDLAFTTNGLDYQADILDTELTSKPYENIQNNSWNIALQSQLKSKISQRHTNQTGFKINFLNYDLFLEQYEDGIGRTIADDQGSSTLFQAFSQSRFELSQKLTFLGGINYQYFAINKQSLLEPRASIKWHANEKYSLGLAYGLHSRTERLNFYLNKDENGIQQNKNMGLTRAHHFVGSYDRQINENLRLKVEPYYQLLFDVPVRLGSSFSFINLKNDWFINDPMANQGQGKNYGIDLTLEKFLSDGYYFLATTSFYKSKYQGGDGEWRSSAFDRGFGINALFGKEWYLGSDKNKILGLNARVNYQGGIRYTPVNRPASIANQEIIELENRAFEGQDDPLMVLHFTASYKINKPKRSSTWTLSILNMTMAEEFEGFAYNYKTNRVDKISETLFVPNISYKINF